MFAQTNSLIAVANAMLAKTLPAFYLQRKIYYLPEARILIIEILVSFFQNETMHGHGFASIAFVMTTALVMGVTPLRPQRRRESLCAKDIRK